MGPTGRRSDRISVEEHIRDVEQEDARIEAMRAGRVKIVDQACDEMAETYSEEFMKVFKQATFKIADVVEFHNDSDAESSPFESLAYIKMLSFAQELGIVDDCWVKYYDDDPEAELPLPFLGVTLSDGELTDSQKESLQEFYDAEKEAIEKLQQ